MKKVMLIVLSVMILAAIVGCGRDETKTGEKTLTFLCGSSFVPPVNQLCEQFTAETSIKVVTTVAGSEDLLPLIKTGQKGDVFVTHDPYLDYIRDAGALEGHIQVGFVAPVLAVQKGNPENLTAIEDLTRSGIKVALSNPQYSTCGELVFRLLEKKGIKKAVMKNVENRLTKGHSTLGNLLKTQTVDAVIMWNGVAHTFREAVDIVRTPYEYDREIRVHIIGLNHSKQLESLEKFLEFAETKGPEIFSAYGYVK